MADLAVTIGLDQKELEEGLKNAGKTIEDKMGDKKIKDAFGIASNIMSGNVGAGVGALFGPVGAAVGQFVDLLVSKARELADYAKELRTIRLKTGLSYQEIEGLNQVAKAAGISTSALADSMVEFKKKSADAFIKGGELIRILPKLGVGLEELREGSFDYFTAIKLLSEAQKAGTDDATMNYYANALLGASYKEMLPLIRNGSSNIKLYNDSIYKNSTEAVDALARFGDAFDIFVLNLKNRAVEILGTVVKFFENASDKSAAEFALARVSRAEGKTEKERKVIFEEAAKEFIKNIGPGYSDEQRMAIAKNATYSGLSENDRKKYLVELERQLGFGAGKKLSPFGFTEAGAASQIQQMAGGDIFGAVGFSPLTMIEKNTKETAENTRPKSESSAPVVQPELIK